MSYMVLDNLFGAKLDECGATVEKTVTIPYIVAKPEHLTYNTWFKTPILPVFGLGSSDLQSKREINSYKLHVTNYMQQTTRNLSQ